MMVDDYRITWDYIVDRMESKYGFKPDNEEKCSFGELMKYLSDIWEEYVDILNKDKESETTATWEECCTDYKYICSNCWCSIEESELSTYRDKCPECGAKMSKWKWGEE